MSTLCVALDVPDLAATRGVVNELRGIVDVFKVGFELFTACGPAAVDIVQSAGAECFLDLKMGDIPSTVAAGVREAAKLGVTWLTVHALGGRQMLRAAVASAAEHGGPNLLAVTVLTSLADDELAELGINATAADQVLRLGTLAASEGVDGLILSGRDLPTVRGRLPGLTLVTPGVRPPGADAGDQRRVLSPAEAVAQGADMLVVGRPIISSPDRAAAAVAILEQMRAA